jgi:hypothetical protein
MIMTDREALDKAQNELNTSGYLAELSLNIGLRKVHQHRIAWLARVLRLARKALYIEENQKQPKTNADRIRAMSDEELAGAWMKDVVVCHRCAYVEECECDEYVTIEKCKEGLLEWLKQPAEG